MTKPIEVCDRCGREVNLDDMNDINYHVDLWCMEPPRKVPTVRRLVFPSFVSAPEVLPPPMEPLGPGLMWDDPTEEKKP